MEKVVGFDALYESAQKCKKGVLWKDSVAHYILNIFTETLRLEEQLKGGTYHPRALKPFSVTSIGKKRTVMGVAFRDRVFQRSLNDNAIYPQITKSFIYDNAACQKNKGTDFARGRLICFLQKFYRKHKTEGYVLQCDISGYYPNMRHDTVEAISESGFLGDLKIDMKELRQEMSKSVKQAASQITGETSKD